MDKYVDAISDIRLNFMHSPIYRSNINFHLLNDEFSQTSQSSKVGAWGEYGMNPNKISSIIAVVPVCPKLILRKRI